MKKVYSESIVSVLFGLGHISQLDLNGTYVTKNIKHSYRNGCVVPVLELRETGDSQYDAFVSYYANQKHYEADRLTSKKVVRYLNANYPDWTTAKILQIANYVRSKTPTQVLFTANGTESREVYENGPDSCMGKDADELSSSPRHPCEVYDPTKGDVCVAYVKRDGRITARTVVWREKKVYGRVYGDGIILEPALKKLGYAYNHEEFEGAKLPYIPAGDGGFLFPYFDGMEYVSVLADQKQVVLHDSHEYLERNSITVIETHTPDSQTGITPNYAGPELYYCDYCETDGHTEDSINHVIGVGQVCGSCFDDFTMCDKCETWCHQDDTIYSPDGCKVYCSDDCWSEHYAKCEECYNDVAIDKLQTNEDGWDVCPDCIDNEEEDDD